MSSNYSISASESSSFCTNPSLNHTHTRHGAPAAAVSSARGARPVEAASSTNRGDVTPKKAAQSTKSAAATQESPSMTIRRVPADYSKRMEDQKARSSALERYKMLVKGNRLVPSDGDASPEPKKAPEVEEADMSTTWRRSDQMPPSSAFRAGSAASQTVLSDVSEEEEAAAATPAGRRTTTGRSQPRKSADPRPPRSVSRRQPPQQQREHSSSTPVSVSVSVERPAYPNSVTPQRDDDDEPPAPAATTVVAIPTLDLNKTQAHQPVQQQQQQQPASAVRPSYSEAEEGAVAYVSPELTQPFGHTSLRPRSTLRPGYEPVTEHRSASLTGDSQLQRTPRRQPASQVRGHSSTVQDRQGVSAQSPTTPRRKSTAKPRAVEAAATSASDAPETRHVDVAATPESQDSTAEGAAQPIVHQTDGGVVPLPGSKTAFWMRPSSAMFEMTTSIAAKRKDRVEQESATARTSSTRRASRSYHAIPTGSTGSPCGTPRGREAEERPRFSTHVSATDRKLYQEGGAAAAVPPAATTYDAIFSQRHSTRRSQKSGAAAADATASSTPRGTPRGGPQQQQQQRRAAPRAGGAVRSPSSLSRLSSSLLSHTPKEEEVGRVSTRQHDALSKHCARVAAGAATAAAAAPPAAQMKANRPGKRATPSAPAAAATAQTQQPAAQAVHKRLDYTATETELDVEEEGEGPVPLTVVPHSSDRQAAQDVTAATPTRRTADNAEVEEESSPHTTIHGRRAGDSTTPSKSRRREHDTTASPPRDDADAIFAAQEAEMAQEKAAARAQQARAALESCRLARQARAEAFRTSHSTTAGGAVSTNEVVAAMLQGIVQQTRQVLPCYLCGELQCTSGYRAHVSACRPATEAILKEYATAVGGQADIPAEVKARVDELAAQEVPLSTSDVAVRDAFAKACYQCVKSMLVPCRKCGTQLRVHDVKEHEMLCGRAYYQNSRAAERVRSAVDRIERGSQD